MYSTNEAGFSNISSPVLGVIYTNPNEIRFHCICSVMTCYRYGFIVNIYIKASCLFRHFALFDFYLRRTKKIVYIICII